MSNGQESLPRKRGRPPTPPAQCRSHRVVTFVTAGELAQLRAIADRDNEAISAIVYRLLVQSL